MTTNTLYTVTAEAGAFVDHVNLPSVAINSTFTTANVDLLLISFDHIGNGTIAVTSDGSPITSGTGVESKAALSLTMTPDTSWASGTLMVNGANTSFTNNSYNFTTTDDVVLHVTFIPQALTGTVYIAGTTTFGETLTASISGDNNTGNLSYKWLRDGTEINASNSYTLVLSDIGKTLTVEVTSSVQTGKITAATAAITKAVNTTTPSVPVLSSKNYNSVTLTPVSGYEYSKDGTNWLPSNVFSDLTASMAYTFYQRIAETTTHLASVASTGLPVTTNVDPSELREAIKNANKILENSNATAAQIVNAISDLAKSAKSFQQKQQK